MLAHAGGAASTASPPRKGSCKSSRETRGLRWGVRGWRKSFGVCCHSPHDAPECWGDLATHWEPIALAGMQTLHTHTYSQNDHALVVWPVHVLEMRTPGGTNSLHAAFCTTRLPREQRDRGVQGAGQGCPQAFGSCGGGCVLAKRGSLWQSCKQGLQGEARRREMAGVASHHFLCFVSKPWGRRC